MSELRPESQDAPDLTTRVVATMHTAYAELRELRSGISEDGERKSPETRALAEAVSNFVARHVELGKEVVNQPRGEVLQHALDVWAEKRLRSRLMAEMYDARQAHYEGELHGLLQDRTIQARKTVAGSIVLANGYYHPEVVPDELELPFYSVNVATGAIHIGDRFEGFKAYVFTGIDADRPGAEITVL